MKEIIFDQTNALVVAMGWMLVHSIWQVTAIGLMALGAVRVFHQQKTSFRYWVYSLSLLTILVVSAATCVFYYEQPKPDDEMFAPLLETLPASLESMNGIDMEYKLSFFKTFEIFINSNLSFIVGFWLLGALFFLVRLGGSLWFLNHLRSNAKAIYQANVLEGFNDLKIKFNLKKTINILESSLTTVPMTIGYLKPIIFLPMGFANGLSPQQLEAILAHELAHIKRNDYLVNLVQSFVEAIFYYHPLVWWLSAQMRIERENCCDDLAVWATNKPLSYAKTLLALQEMQGYKGTTVGTNLAMPLAAAHEHEKKLLQRIKRILITKQQNKSNIMEKMTISSLFLGLCLVGFLGNSLASNQSETVSSKLSAILTQESVVDSLPPKSRRTKIENMRTEDSNGRSVEMQRKDGKITKLVIDGQTISEQDYEKYKDIIDAMGNDTPNPPTPPSIRRENSPKSIKENETTTVIIQNKKDGKGEKATIEIDGDKVTINGKPVDEANGSYDIKILKGNEKANGSWEDRTGDVRTFHFNSPNMKMMMDSLHNKMLFFKSDGLGDMDIQFSNPEHFLSENFHIKIDSMMKKFELFNNIDITLDNHLGEEDVEKIQKELDTAGSRFNEKWFGEMKNISPVEAELYKDGLVKRGESFSLELSDKEMILNDKNQPKSVHEKYKRIYKETTPSQTGEKFKFSFKRGPEGAPKSKIENKRRI